MLYHSCQIVIPKKFDSSCNRIIRVLSTFRACRHHRTLHRKVIELESRICCSLPNKSLTLCAWWESFLVRYFFYHASPFFFVHFCYFLIHPQVASASSQIELDTITLIYGCTCICCVLLLHDNTSSIVSFFWCPSNSNTKGGKKRSSWWKKYYGHATSQAAIRQSTFYQIDEWDMSKHIVVVKSFVCWCRNFRPE